MRIECFSRSEWLQISDIISAPPLCSSELYELITRILSFAIYENFLNWYFIILQIEKIIKKGLIFIIFKRDDKNNLGLFFLILINKIANSKSLLIFG